MLAITLAVFLFIGGIYLIKSSLTFKKCADPTSLVPANIRCASVNKTAFLEQAVISLEVDRVEHVDGGVYLLLKYPFLGFLSQPMRFYLGTSSAKDPKGTPRVNICTRPDSCKLIEARKAETVLQPGQLIAFVVLNPVGNIRMNEYFTKCRQAQRDFITMLADKKTVLSFLNSKAFCAPVIFQIFVK